MRQILKVTIVALALAATTGCQCCDSLVQFEQCKNECLFGWLRGCCLFGSQTCAPACAPACGPTGCPPTGAPQLYAPTSFAPTSYAPTPFAPTSYAPAACDPCATQYGPQMVAPYGGDCAGGTVVMSAPSCPGGCPTTYPGQTMVMPGQTVVMPNSTLAPTPVPTLQP